MPERVAGDEANAVLNLARLAQVWSDEDRERVEDALSAYARHVVDIEWPAMAHSQFDESSAHRPPPRRMGGGQRSRRARRKATQSTPRHFSSSMNWTRHAVAGCFLAEIRLPEAMTLTLIVGAVVTVGFSYLFAVEDGWIQGLMTASLATLVALLLLLEYQLDTPFEGVSAIGPTAMELVRTEIDTGWE